MSDEGPDCNQLQPKVATYAGAYMILEDSKALANAPQTLHGMDHDTGKHLSVATQPGKMKNTHLTVFCLPPEVLSIIFECLAFDCNWGTTIYLRNRVRYPLRNYHPCLRVTHVCRVWRNVALGMPWIWGVVQADCSKKWFELLLERSKSAPLYIRRSRRLDYWRQGWEQEAVPLALQIVERLKEICIDVCGRKDHPYVQHLLDSRTPLLEHLTIASSAGLKPQTYRRTLVGIQGLPHLRTLHLINCTLDLNMPVFSALRELTIDLEHVGYHLPGVRFSINDFLTTLRSMPHLRALDLRHVFSCDDQVLPDFVIRLPCLTHVSMVDACWSNMCTFKNITAPNLQSLWISCNGADIAMSSVAPIIVLLPSPLSTIRHIKLDIRIESSSSILTIQMPCPRQEKIGPLTTSFKIDSNSWYSLEHAHILCAALPNGPNVVSLTCRLDIPSDSMWEFLRGLTQAEELHSRDLNELLLILRDTPQKAKGSKTVPPFSLPALRRITVVQRTNLGYKNRVLPKLQRLLQTRASINAPITQLKLAGIDLTPKEMSDLSKIVDVEIIQDSSREYTFISEWVKRSRN